MNISYKQAFFGLLIIQILYFTPIIFKGEVIFPHNNDREVSSQAKIEEDNQISNRKFSDHSSQFIPSINKHLKGQYRAWLATWDPHVQLGRPLSLHYWTSKANLFTHALSLFTSNPFVLYTGLVILLIFLTGIFCFLFLKSLGLHPLACFGVAVGFSLGPYVSYWLTFEEFIAPKCWLLGLLWLNLEFIKKRSIITGVGIAFFTYNLIMMGRLQSVVSSAYLIVGFTMIYLWISTHSVKMKFYTTLLFGGLALFGTITTLPYFLDLITNVSRSARIGNVGDVFF